MKNLRHGFLAAFLGTLLLLGACTDYNSELNATSASAFPIVANGQSDYRIAVDAEAPPAVGIAAEDFARVVRKATGVELPVETIDDWSDFDIEAPWIVLGPAPVPEAEALLASLDKPESTRIQTVGRSLFIVGDDDAEGDPLDAFRYPARAGTLIGTARFLRDELGARWYAPGELWESIPERESWTLDPTDRLYEPAFPLRGVSTQYVHTLDRDVERKTERARTHGRWARRNGTGMAVNGFPTHSFKHIMAPYIRGDEYTGKEEWLALVDGRRRPPRTHLDNPNRYWHGVKLDVSNPEVVEIFADYVRRQHRQNPDLDVISIGMSDGHGHCESEAARALDGPGGNLTDRYLHFYNRVAEAVDGDLSENVHLGIFAYQVAEDPPGRERNIHPRLSISHVQNNIYFHSEADWRERMEKAREWGELASHIGFFTAPAGMGLWGVPLPQPERAAAMVRKIGEFGFDGFYKLDATPQSMQPDPYIYARLLEDPSLDVRELLDEYYEDLFGPVAPNIRRYHDLLEAQTRKSQEGEIEVDGMDGLTGPYARLEQIYGTVLDELRAELDAAAANAPDEATRKRVAQLRVTFDTAEMVLEAGRLHDDLMAGGGNATRQKVLSLRDRFRAHLREHAFTDALEPWYIARTRAGDGAHVQSILAINADMPFWIERPEPQVRRLQENIGFLYIPPTAALEGEKILNLEDNWKFRIDPENEGYQRGWHKTAPDQDWQPIRVDRPWTEQGVDHHGVAWYTTTFRLPAHTTPDNLKLLFRAVDGNTHVWIDGRKVGEQTGNLHQMWDKPWALDISGHVQPGKSHRLAVMVRKDSRAAGIWKPVEIRRAAD